MYTYTMEGVRRNPRLNVIFDNPENLYEPVSWGFAWRKRSEVSGHELLVAERAKEDDFLRRRQLVIPGGGLKAGENYLAAAVRETEEETGISAAPRCEEPIAVYRVTIIKPREEVIAIVDGADIWVHYRDSGRRYRCRMFDLDPANGEVQEQPGSDAERPRFISLTEALRNAAEFTPACRIALEIGSVHIYGDNIIKPEDIELKRGNVPIEAILSPKPAGR
jgi:8-oxo-dGTP pyrophosphatase MutT (NUDIX family)